ncbi:MAG: DUF3087 family protein [Gammaproteobacteria bacterium]
MFEIREIDPQEYRTRTRNAMLRIMALYLPVGFTTSYTFPRLLGETTYNPFVLQIIGAIIGLALVFWLTIRFFKHQDWMKEAMYGWQLKRCLMYITNAMQPLQKKVEAGDVEAMKLLRFYHLGVFQMYRLEQNASDLVDHKVEMDRLEEKMMALGLELNQTRFDLDKLKQVTAKN